MPVRLINNATYQNLFSPSKRIAVIGVKGMPPEFAGTSGVEFYVARRLPVLRALKKSVVCYVRAWATPTRQKKYQSATLTRLPSINTVHLDAVSHSFLATVHASFSPVDTVWYQATGPALFAPVARLLGKRVIVTIHTKEWERNKWGGISKAVLHAAEFLAIRFATTVITVSKDLSRYLTETYGITAIVDPLQTPPVGRAPLNTLQQKYGLSPLSYILFMGRFVPEKRIEWLIEGFSKLPHKHGLRLVIAGGGHTLSRYEKKLRQLAGDVPGITFVGWVFGKEKEALLSHCRLFVLPSQVEGNPIVLQELQPGTIALVSDEVTQTGTSAKIYTFPTQNKERFIQTLIYLATKRGRQQ